MMIDRPTMEDLVADAWETMTWRDHDPSGENGEIELSPTLTRLTCNDCGLTADCNTAPLPNQIDIGGAAVAVNCGRDAANTDRSHDHVWATEISRSVFAGTPHRVCTYFYCDAISLDLTDDDTGETDDR